MTSSMRASEGNQANDRAPNYTRKDTSGGDLNSVCERRNNEISWYTPLHAHLAHLLKIHLLSAESRRRQDGGEGPSAPLVYCNYSLYAAPTPEGRKRLVATPGVALIGVLAQFVEIRCQNLERVGEVGTSPKGRSRSQT
ncbi:hypothetical protein BDZ89DRAFT_1037295 [Hymenopellis radicata]|nr:hypothetical protein BDZ89DRAFT_1037295 [Hymenopellis radicata]